MEGTGKAVPLVWVGVEQVPVLYVNSLISQFDADGAFLLTAGQVMIPALVGTPEQIEEQAEDIDFVQVRPVARLAFTRSKLVEVIETLQANLEQFDKASTMRGDPRGG